MRLGFTVISESLSGCAISYMSALLVRGQTWVTNPNNIQSSVQALGLACNPGPAAFLRSKEGTLLRTEKGAERDGADRQEHTCVWMADACDREEKAGALGKLSSRSLSFLFTTYAALGK